MCRSALEGVARGPAAPDWLRRITAMQGAPTSSGHLQTAALGAGGDGGAGDGVVGADALLDMDLGELVGRLKAEKERSKKRRREGGKKRKKGKRRREKSKEKERSGKRKRSSQRRRDSGSSGSSGNGSDSSEDRRGGGR